MKKELIEECIGKINKFLDNEFEEKSAVRFDESLDYDRFIIEIEVAGHIEAYDGGIEITFPEAYESISEGLLDIYSYLRHVTQLAFSLETSNLSVQEYLLKEWNKL